MAPNEWLLKMWLQLPHSLWQAKRSPPPVLCGPSPQLSVPRSGFWMGV